MKQIVKHLLFILLMLLLLLPFVQQQWNILQMEPLKGAIETPVQPAFSAKNFYGSSYQDSLNTFVEQHIGFRPFLVRVNNQLHYSLFRKVFAKGVVVGKQGYLYEQSYINSYFGLDFAGEVKIKKDIEEFVVVNNWLKQNNKNLLVVLAPGKARYFHEFIPDHLRPDTISGTNYEQIKRGLVDNKIAHIDVNEWFTKLKPTTHYPLFPKSGIHWSHYGMYLAFDSILRKAAEVIGHSFVKFEYNSIVLSDSLRKPDQDIWEGLNLFFQPNDYPMPYLDFRFVDAKPDLMPKTIVVGDSFYWQFFGSGFATRSFNQHDFWYYNSLIFPGDGRPAIERKEVDLLAEVNQKNLIIILQTEAALDRLGFGFIHDLYKLINEDVEAEQGIFKIIQTIKSSPEWLKSIEDKAKQRGYTVEEMIRIDAEWLYYNQRY